MPAQVMVIENPNFTHMVTCGHVLCDEKWSSLFLVGEWSVACNEHVGTDYDTA